jgi:hypothetical protein
MFNSKSFYNASIRKYTVLMGHLLSEITITHDDADGNAAQSFQVPIGYGPKEKFLARVEEDPTFERGFAVQLPRIAFEIIGFEYDGSRKLSTTQTYVKKTSARTRISYERTYVPVPYNITFRVDIIANKIEDGNRIVEQILPYFTPDWTVTVKMLDNMPDYSVDIPIVLTNVALKDDYEGDLKKPRVITWSLDFTMQAYFWGPQTEAKIIKIVNVNYYTETDATNPSEKTIITPGLTANGEPTSVYDDSIPVAEINENDLYGYVIRTYSVDDGPYEPSP